MVKRILGIMIVLSLITVVGCSSVPVAITPTPVANVKQVRQAEISGKWVVKQLEINLESSISIVLMLAEGGTVEGFFYLEKGNNIDFQITGESLIYESKPTDAKSASVTSDRFSFTASDGQGKAYTLKLTPGISKDEKNKTDTTVFLEIIYPVTGEV